MSRWFAGLGAVLDSLASGAAANFRQCAGRITCCRGIFAVGPAAAAAAAAGADQKTTGC